MDERIPFMLEDPGECPIFKKDDIPHLCPICRGCGFKPHWFYGLPLTTASEDVQCRSCNGQGYIMA